MKINSITTKSDLWNKLIEYTHSCEREAGPILAQKMKENKFLDWERVFVATENKRIIGFCTFTQEDGIPNCDYFPFVGFIFVDKNYRGKRVSEKMVNEAEKYAKSLNYKKLYIVSDYKGLYEKYGFKKCDEKADEMGHIESIFCRDI